MPPPTTQHPPRLYGSKSKRGPKPFPGSRRKRCNLRVPPPQPVLRPKTTYTKEQKTEVLLYLIHHRIYEVGRCAAFPHDVVVSRTPTYRDAEKYWRIPIPTIDSWWRNREKYLPPAELEHVKSYDPHKGPPIHRQPEASRHPVDPQIPGGKQPARAEGVPQEPVNPVGPRGSGSNASESGDEQTDLNKDSDAGDANETISANRGDSVETANTDDGSTDEAHVDAKRGAGDESNVDANTGDEVQLAVDQQLSANVAAHRDTGRGDIEDSAEVHAAIFDLQSA